MHSHCGKHRKRNEYHLTPSHLVFISTEQRDDNDSLSSRGEKKKQESRKGREWFSVHGAAHKPRTVLTHDLSPSHGIKCRVSLSGKHLHFRAVVGGCSGRKFAACLHIANSASTVTYVRKEGGEKETVINQEKS